MGPKQAQQPGGCMTSIRRLQAVVPVDVVETETSQVAETQIQREKEQDEDLSHLILTSGRLQFLVAVMTLVQWPADSQQQYIITNLKTHSLAYQTYTTIDNSNGFNTNSQNKMPRHNQ